jgi:hypothetical protein
MSSRRIKKDVDAADPVRLVSLPDGSSAIQVQTDRLPYPERRVSAERLVMSRVDTLFRLRFVQLHPLADRVAVNAVVVSVPVARVAEMLQSDEFVDSLKQRAEKLGYLPSACPYSLDWAETNALKTYFVTSSLMRLTLNDEHAEWLFFHTSPVQVRAFLDGSANPEELVVGDIAVTLPTSGVLDALLEMHREIANG